MLTSARRFVSTFVLISTFAPTAFAAITEVGISAPTASFIDTKAESLKIIIGKGTACGDTFTANTACTVKTAADSDRVIITYKAGAENFPKIVGINAGSRGNIYTESTKKAAGSQIVADISWAEICAKTNSGACTDHSSTIEIGVSADVSSTTLSESATISFIVSGSSTPTTSTCNSSDEGMCDFQLVRGDEKAIIPDGGLSDNGNIPQTPGSSGLLLDRVRFFYIKLAPTATDCSSITTANFAGINTFVERKITSEGGAAALDSDILDGLENGIPHCFIAASMDQASNLGYWTQNVQYVKPQQVSGFFLEENNCFIATAAYGSIMDKRVQTFRDFRDRVLSNFSWGRKFVYFYYQHAYSWAKVIQKSDFLRALTRVLLWPIWLFAKLSVMFSWQMALFIFAAPLLGLIIIGNSFRSGNRSGIKFFIFLALIGGMLFVSQAHAATEKAKAKKPKRIIAQETPPPEAPFPGASENEEEEATPLKTPKVKKSPTTALPVTEPGEPEVVRVTKEGVYYYKRKASPQRSAFSFRAGPFHVANAVNANGIAFDEIYAAGGPIIFFDYEFQLIQSIGKLGLKLGTGIFTTTGNGRFTDDGSEATEQYRFVLLPNNISAIYRAQFWEKQFLVPFAEAGAGYYTFLEVRDDRKRTTRGGVPVGQVAFGGSLLLDFLDSAAMVEMDEDHGVNHLYLTAEYRLITSFKEDFDVSNNMFSAGFLFEF